MNWYVNIQIFIIIVLVSTPQYARLLPQFLLRIVRTLRHDATYNVIHTGPIASFAYLLMFVTPFVLQLPVFVNKIWSPKTQLPYSYYSLPFCRPSTIVTQKGNIGQILVGDSIQNSDYEVRT